MTRSSLLLLTIFTALTLPLAAQETPRPWYEATKLSLLAFGDAYAIADHHNDELEGKNGFLLRRIYFTVDQKISPTLSGRFRLELNQPGDYVTSDTLDPYVKDAWIRWQRTKNTDFTFGMWQTSAYDTVEALWGYRAVEKTPLDLQRWVSTRDFGISAGGRFAADPRVHYRAEIGNGAGTGSETNEGKRAALVLGFAPTTASVVEVYGDLEERPGETDRATLQFVAGYRGEGFRVGAQYGRQSRERAGGDLNLDLASVFGVWNVRENVRALARVDRMFDPNPEGNRIAYLPLDPTAKATLVIAGVDFQLNRTLGVIPNVEWVTYDEGASSPGDDLFARLTFYFSF